MAPMQDELSKYGFTSETEFKNYMERLGVQNAEETVSSLRSACEMADGEDKTDHLEFVGRMIAQLKIQEKAMAVMGGVPGIGPGSVQSQQEFDNLRGGEEGVTMVQMLAWAAADDSRKEIHTFLHKTIETVKADPDFDAEVADNEKIDFEGFCTMKMMAANGGMRPDGI